ncbi:MAG: trypsin-like serine protease [Alphaproteobacteria bacterium]|nr:trypsin-like serine protease [Alphaproteobacteria bacterium]
MKAGLLLALVLAATPAGAIVGGARRADGIASSVVTIVGSRGNFCTGAVVAPRLVLTAAHCVVPGADYRIVDSSSGRLELRSVRRVAIHPGFNSQGMRQHRASADVALLQLDLPLVGRRPLAVGTPQTPVRAGSRFTIVGNGVTIRGDGKSGGVTRSAELVVTGQPGTWQIRLVDPATGGTRAGLSACTGDSGGPVFEVGGRTGIVGVVSWAVGANESAGCGGLTGVTPLTLYREWILQTMREWGTS